MGIFVVAIVVSGTYPLLTFFRIIKYHDIWKAVCMAFTTIARISKAVS